MCGICGIFNLNSEKVEPLISQMVTALKHRGPDTDGIMCKDNVGFGHTRLSILDLSERANQPMPNKDGSLWIVYNGEIFNHRELRKTLISKGYSFRSTSDTETLLYLYEEFGKDCLDKIEGFYSFAIWDSKNNKLFAARDRLGVKPFYYYFDGSTFCFASEIKGLLKLPFIKKGLNKNALSDYFTFMCITAGHSIFSNISQLPPSNYLIVKDNKIEINEYFRFERKTTRNNIDYDEIKHLTEKYVKSRLLSDVPVGLLLSGGLDSSIILSIMAQNSSSKIHTFSVGFSDVDKHFNELEKARKIADYFDTEHHEIVLNTNINQKLPKVIKTFDEPFAGTSIPLYDICDFASNTVKVVLSGIGGDEAAAGYPRHLAALNYSYYELIPIHLRKILKYIGQIIPKTSDPYNIRNRILKFLRSGSLPVEKAYLEWNTYASAKQVRQLVNVFPYDSRKNLLNFTYKKPVKSVEDAVLLDLMHYLPFDLLFYSDRTSMAHGLELREPLCSYEYQQYFLSIPLKEKIKHSNLKYLYKTIFKDSLPEGIIDQRKQGFSMPVNCWLQDNSVKKLLENMATTDFWKNIEELNPKIAADLVKSFLKGNKENTYSVWALLNFALWYVIYIKNENVDKISDLNYLIYM